MSEQLYDVVAVNIKTNKVRLIATKKTRANAAAIETMAVSRRGVEEEFYGVVTHGRYTEGDNWQGE